MYTLQELKQMNEQEIRSRLISPAIRNAGWSDRQIGEEYTFKTNKRFTDGQVVVDPKTTQTKRIEAKRVDYLLYTSANQKIAVVEAKDNHHSSRHGLQQAMTYARLLDVPLHIAQMVMSLWNTILSLAYNEPFRCQHFLLPTNSTNVGRNNIPPKS